MNEREDDPWQDEGGEALLFETDFCTFCLAFHGDVACPEYLAVQGEDVFMIGDEPQPEPPKRPMTWQEWKAVQYQAEVLALLEKMFLLPWLSSRDLEEPPK